MTVAGPAVFLSKWGSEDQKQRYLPALADGSERFSISLTEPEAGSALTELRTRAEIRGDECVVNGQKLFCSGAPHADHFLVFVRFGPGTEGIGAVIVARDTPGLTIGKVNRHLSGAQWSELFFDDATIPAADVLFDGSAFKRLMSSYSLERCGAAAFVLGVAELAQELAVAYVEERRQFGRRISDFELVQAKLADMYIALEGSAAPALPSDGAGRRRRALAARLIGGQGRGDRGRVRRHRPGDAASRRRWDVAGDAARVALSGGPSLHRRGWDLRHPPQHDRQRDGRAQTRPPAADRLSGSPLAGPPS